MRFRSLLLPLVLVTITIGLGLRAQASQAKPDFSGQWTLVADKSDFGQMPAPTSMTFTIMHKEPVLTIVIVQTGGTSDSTTTMIVSTDGKPHTNDVGGNAVTTTGKWDGQAIVLHGTANMQGDDVTLDYRLELSDGGKTLTGTRKIATPADSFTSTVVMAKK